MSKILVILHSCFYWTGRPVHLRIILNKETVTVPEEILFFCPRRKKWQAIYQEIIIQKS